MISEQQVWNALPSHGFVRSYVEYASQCTDANIAYHVAGALSCLSQCVPENYAVPYASPIYGNIYSMIVGDSSKSRKTASINIAQRITAAAIPNSIGEMPGSQEGLYEGLRQQPKQLVVYGEWGEFLAKAEEGYMMALKTSFTNLWDCIEKNTEILTPLGWKGKDDLKIGDECYSMNLETGKLEVTPILDIGERPVRPDEKMFVLKGQRSDIRATEGHNFFLKYRVKGKLSDKFMKKTGREFAAKKGEYVLPLAALPAQDFAGVPLTDDELRFIAWFMTDGGFAGGAGVRISQSKPAMVKHIRSLLTRLGVDFTERIQKPNKGTFANGKPCHIFNVPKGTAGGSLKRNGWAKYEPYLSKDVSPELHKMTRDQFFTFWQEALKGDGDNTRQEWASDGLYCDRKTQADTYTHMAAARGFATSYGTRVTKSGTTVYRVVVRDSQWLQSNPSMAAAQKPRLEDPEPGEMVWCVTNRNSTIVTRRNGKVAIIGNCLPVGRALANKRQGAIQNPRLSLLCGVATDLLERHTEQADWTGGFLARFFTLFAEPEREFPTPPVDDPLARKNITDWLNQLANPAVPSGTCLWLDVPARKMWTDWYESMRPLRDGANRRAGAACSRSSAIAAKIALLLAWDIGDARSGYDWSVGIKELEPALKLTDLHLSSVLELGERVTGSKDMRDRAAVLRAIEEVPTPVGVILRGAEMLKRRAKEVLESLEEERSIERVTVGREVCYRRTPLAQAALVNMVEQQKAAAAAGSAQSVVGPAHNVLAFPAPPAPTTTHPAFANMPDVDLLPASELLNMLDPSELDEVDWSRYGG